MNDRIVNQVIGLGELCQRLERIGPAQTERRMYGAELQVYCDLEAASRTYYWDGLRRGGDPAHPLLLFQYTLDGWGVFEDRTGPRHMQLGMAFTAIIPSEHRYYLPRESAHWKYFWMILAHPYIVQRVATRLREFEAVQTLEPTHPLLTRMVALYESHRQQRADDQVAREEMLFAWLWEFERLWHRSRPEAERERLLDEVRQFVVAEIHRPIGVDELARWRGMSRSNFSHFFKATTGIAPAPFVQQIRLDEAARQLLHSQQSVADIALATGFANANHFCRVFRQHFHLSPGAFRRQMR